MGLFQAVVAESGGSVDGLLGIALEIAPLETRIGWQVVVVTGDVDSNIRRTGDFDAAIFNSGDFTINRINVNNLHEFNVILQHRGL